MAKYRIRKRKEQKGQHNSRGRACPGHQYVLEYSKRAGHFKLVCQNCRRFYGFIKSSKDEAYYKQQIREHGFLTL